MSDFLFFFLGLATGTLGTLVGAGGGFLLAPIFIFLFPVMEPARLTAISLLAVCANSLSGSAGYAMRKMIHWPSVGVFALMGLPGAYIGVELSEHLPRDTFELIFGLFLITMSGFVVWRSFRKRLDHSGTQFWTKKSILIGGFISFFIGVLSSLLGIGGGIIHVPLLSEFLKYPVHIAAGTSQAILAITSLVAVITHFVKGGLNNLESFVPYLVVGLVIGAQIGAALSKRVSSRWILRILGLALLTVGLRLLIKNV